MSIDKLKNKFSTGAFVADVKHYFSKINEIIDYLNNLVIPDAPTYKVYSALLNQADTDDPTANILENTLGGTLVWTRVGVGEYLATLNGLFLENKVLILITANEGNQIIGGFRNSNNDVYLSKKDLATGLYTDGLVNINIEIKVYN